MESCAAVRRLWSDNSMLSSQFGPSRKNQENDSYELISFISVLMVFFVDFTGLSGLQETP